MMERLEVAAGEARIPGLRFRRVEAVGDYAAIGRVGERSRDPEGSAFHGLPSSDDPTTDVVVVEVYGQVIGYGHCSCYDQYVGGRVYEVTWLLLPQWHGRHLQRATLRIIEARAREIDARDAVRPAFLQTRASDQDDVRQSLLLEEGYEPVRHSFTMARPMLPAMTDATLPRGLEIREVRSDDMKAIWQAHVEAFRDHWGSGIDRADGYARFLADPIENDTTLWRIAWDEDQVAGQVRSFINEAENRLYGRQRGWVEHISVRRPWRHRGLARALIAESISLLAARGMTESALGVDTQNVTGALHLYAGMGFRPVARRTFYRKPLVQASTDVLDSGIV